MGFFSALFGRLGVSKKKVKVLCVGLDNSGKSTVINHLKPKKTAATELVPTVGFAVEEFSKNNLNFTVFDMSGQGRYRSLWEHYYKEVTGIVFVIDATDKIRMCVAKDELDTLLAHADIRNVPILFLANKIDLPLATSPVECVAILELDRIVDKPWHISCARPPRRVAPLLRCRADPGPCAPAPPARILAPAARLGGRRATNAVTGAGLDEALSWLADQMSRAPIK